MNPGRSDTRPARRGAALIAGVVLAACATNPATGRRQLSLVSEAQEIQMGREADQQVTASIGLYPEASLQSYLQRVGAGLAASSERPNLQWTFRVVDDPTVNAFALPGGYIYVTRGLLTHLNSEAELASVLGHEIGHVTARHSVSQMSKAQLLNVGLIVGMILRPQLQNFGGLAQAGLELLFLKYSRNDESQADELGLRYLTRAGYDPRPMTQVFRTLERVGTAEGEGRVPTWLSTHPDPGDRERRIAAAIAALPAGQAGSRVERDAYLQRIDGIVFGDQDVLDTAVDRARERVAPIEIVVLVGRRHDGRPDRSIDPGRRAQLELIRERRPQPACDRLADRVGVRVVELERHDDAVVADERGDSQRLLGSHRRHGENQQGQPHSGPSHHHAHVLVPNRDSHGRTPE